MTTLTDNVNKNSKTKQTKNKRFAVKGFFPAIGRQPRPLPAPPQVLATSVRSVTFDTVFSLSWSRGGGGGSHYPPRSPPFPSTRVKEFSGRDG